MSSKKNIELAHTWYEQMWSKPDYDLADQIIDPHYDPDWVHIPKKGSEQVKHEIRYFRSVFPDLKYEIVDTIAADDRVWIRYKGTGTQSGNAWGFEPTNQQVEFEGVTILYVSKAGKIVDRWGAFCFYDILSDLELVPPLWELKDHLRSK